MDRLSQACRWETGSLQSAGLMITALKQAGYSVENCNGALLAICYAGRFLYTNREKMEEALRTKPCRRGRRS